MKIELSPLEKERFGFKTARAVDVTAGTLAEIMDFCRVHAVQFLIARIDASELKAVQEAEKQDFLLMDTLMYAKRDVLTSPIPLNENTNVLVRPYRPGDEMQIRAVAVGAFRDYGGHYHADERLDRRKCDEVYEDWAVNSCVSDGLADIVLVAEHAGSIASFVALRTNQVTDEGEIRLFAVAPWAQRQGIARSLMLASMAWCRDQGRSSLLISTQIINYPMRKVWTRLGFEPVRAVYTFHRWFD
jgi:GNAT superfamily N-acetyltransferase